MPEEQFEPVNIGEKMASQEDTILGLMAESQDWKVPERFETAWEQLFAENPEKAGEFIFRHNKDTTVDEEQFNSKFFRFMVFANYRRGYKKTKFDLEALGLENLSQELAAKKTDSKSVIENEGLEIAKKNFAEAIMDAKREARLLGEAGKDQLTGLWSRKALEAYTKHLIELGKVEGSDLAGLAVIMLDLDNFKGVNTEKGHAFGDRVLQIVGKRMRRFDVPFRYGGEELIIMMPIMVGQNKKRTLVEPGKELDKSTQLEIFRRGKEIHRDHLTNILIQDEASLEPFIVNSSGGMVFLTKNKLKNTDDPTELWVRAGHLLKVAKESGKNRLITRHDMTTGSFQ